MLLDSLEKTSIQDVHLKVYNVSVSIMQAGSAYTSKGSGVRGRPGDLVSASNCAQHACVYKRRKTSFTCRPLPRSLSYSSGPPERYATGELESHLDYGHKDIEMSRGICGYHVSKNKSYCLFFFLLLSFAFYEVFNFNFTQCLLGLDL